MAQIVVTGVAGFIGSTLAEKLLEQNHDVLGIDSITDYYSNRIKEKNVEICLQKSNFTFLQQDLSEIDLKEIFENVQYVFHLAGQPGVRKSWGKDFKIYNKNNIIVTQKILESLKDHNTLKKFVLASSSSVYGNQSGILNEEKSLTRPVSPYGVTKLAAENLTNLYYENFKIPTVSLRYFTVYGPKQRPDMAFTKFLYSIINDKKISIYGNGEQTRDFTYVDDIVSATINAATCNPVGKIFNIGGGSVTSITQIIEIMKTLSSKDLKIEFTNEQKGDVKHTNADITKSKKLLDYIPKTDIKTGLQKQFDFIKNNQSLYDGIIT